MNDPERENAKREILIQLEELRPFARARTLLNVGFEGDVIRLAPVVILFLFFPLGVGALIEILSGEFVVTYVCIFAACVIDVLLVSKAVHWIGFSVLVQSHLDHKRESTCSK